MTQGGQTRTFRYDSLKRLRTAANPESGTVTYAYDDSGNLASKSDARVTKTMDAYDGMNRATRASYSDATPQVVYSYDTDLAISGHTEANYPSGRLVQVAAKDASNNVVSSTTYRFDNMGRPASSSQKTGTANPRENGAGKGAAVPCPLSTQLP